MSSIEEDDWLEFEAMVEANGPSMITPITKEIIFRGSDEKISIEYVRHPYEDAKKFAEIMKNNSPQFKDAGFHAILPLAKTVEMHIRLLFLGESKKDFENNAFQMAKAIKAMKQIGNRNEPIEPIEGFGKKKFKPNGLYWGKFCSSDVEFRDKLIKAAEWIYRQGNQYRHNQIKSWSQIESEYKKIIKSLKRFIECFNRIME